MPVARVARPVPSTSTVRAICVSVVVRSAVAARVGIAVSLSAIAYTKSALGERLRERGKTSPVLLRRPDGKPDAVIEQGHAGMQVLDQHAPAAHPLEDLGGVGNANQDEIRIAWKDRYAGQLAQLPVKALALGVDAARLRVEHFVMREDALGDHVGKHADVVRGPHLVEFADPLGP